MSVQPFVAMVGIVVLFAVGCAGAASAPSAEETGPVASVTRGDFERGLLLTGELQAVQSVAIKAPQTSLFQLRIQFMAEEGSVVREGETVLEFDNSSLTDQVRSLETQILDAETQIVSKRAETASKLKDLEIELAEREYQYGITKLDADVDAEVLSRKEYAERQLSLMKAERELQETHERVRLTTERGVAELDVLVINRDKLQKDMLTAEADRERLTLKAPSTGLVVYERRQGTTLRFQEGDSCWPGQAVLRLPDLDAMQVEFSVNEVDAPLLERGMELSITVDAFPGRTLSGRVTQIPSMAVKRDDRSKIAVFKVRASLSETWIGEMKPGMSALGRVALDRRADVPLVARNAVTFRDGAYRVRASGGGEPQSIEPIARNERFYVLHEQDWARLNGAGGTANASTATAGIGGTTP